MAFPDNPVDGTIFVTPTGAAYKYVAAEQYWLPYGLGEPLAITYNSRRIFPRGTTGNYGTTIRAPTRGVWLRNAGSRIDILHKTSGAGETYQTYTNSSPGTVGDVSDNMTITGIFARSVGSSPTRQGRISVRNPNAFAIALTVNVTFGTSGMTYPLAAPSLNGTNVLLAGGVTQDYYAATAPQSSATVDADNEWPITIVWRRATINGDLPPYAPIRTAYSR